MTKGKYSVVDKVKIAFSALFVLGSLVVIIAPVINFAATFNVVLQIVIGVIILATSSVSLYRALTKNHLW